MSSKAPPSPAARLEQVRDELAEALDQLAALPERPLPHEEAIERAAALVNATAAAFQGPYRAQVFTKPAGADLAQRDLLNLVAIDQGRLESRVDSAPLLCWLFADAIKTKLADEIAALELPDALPSAEREPEHQRLLGKVTVLEAEEERIIRVLEDEGAEIDRRPDAPISLILAPTAELSEHPPLEAAA